MSRGRPRKRPKAPRHFIGPWREAKGLSPAELADRLGVDISTVSRLEAGDIHYTQQSLEQVAEALGVEPGDLVGVDPRAANYDLWSVVNDLPPEKREQVVRVVKALTSAA